MMDAECPYCGEEVEINHDDGYGYEEGRVFQQECGNCEKYFTFTTCIHFSYDTQKADCLNGEEHKWEPSKTYPKEYTRMICCDCDKRRDPTKEEWEKINGGVK